MIVWTIRKRLFFTLAFLLPVALLGCCCYPNVNLGLTCIIWKRPSVWERQKPLLGWRIDTDRAGYLQGSYRGIGRFGQEGVVGRGLRRYMGLGIVADGKSQHVKFAGTPLLLVRLLLKVKVWDVSGLEIELEPRCISWRTGLFEEFGLGRGMGFVQIRRTASAPQV